MANYLTSRQRRGNAEMLYLIEQYKRAHQDPGEEVFPHLVAEWAIREGLWQRPPVDPQDILRRSLSRALREEYIEDEENNRQVRKWHAVLEEVKTPEGIVRRPKWLEIHDAPAAHMRIAFSLRRRAAMADVIQLEFDYEYWTENNKFGETLPTLDYNFNPDVEESKQPTEYPDERIDGEGENPEEEIL